jgi:hypothetical protein
MVVAFSASILCIASVHLASAAIRRSFSVQQGISLQPDLVGRHSHVVASPYRVLNRLLLTYDEAP